MILEMKKFKYFALVALLLCLGTTAKAANGNEQCKQIKSTLNLTNLMALTLTSIPFEDFCDDIDIRVGGGDLTKIGKDVIVMRGRKFYHFDVKQKKIVPLDIEFPNNGALAAYKFFSCHPKRKKRKDCNKLLKNSRVNEALNRNTRVNDILVVPQEDKNILLVSYVYWNKEKSCFDSRFARTDIPKGVPVKNWKVRQKDWHVVFNSFPCLEPVGYLISPALIESGGALALSEKANHVYFTLGNFGGFGSYLLLHRKDETNLGSIFEIDLTTNAASKISQGHRNSQGLALDKDNNLWAVEHGPRGGDELNLIKKGKHYGWPFVSYGTSYTSFNEPYNYFRSLVGEHNKKRSFFLWNWIGKEKYQKPIFAFVPSIGISDIALIDGFSPLWDGDFLISSLRASQLFRVRIVKGHVMLVEPIVQRTAIMDLKIKNFSWRAILNYGDGKIIVLRRWGRGLLLIETNRGKKIHEGIDVLAKAPPPWRAHCASCHGFLGEGTSAGPSLRGLFKRTMGGAKWDGYSDGFRAARRQNRRWDEETLKAFLKQPNSVIPGTTMPTFYLKDKAINKTIGYIKILGQN